MMKEATIEIHGLTTGYATRKGFVEVARDLNAEIFKGELTCLLGPNGAGKSTLLKTLCGFLMPLKGNISIEGKDLRNYSQQALSRKIGVVLTERPDTMSMTVEQLVGLGRSPYTGFWGRLTGSDARVVRTAMETAGVDGMSYRLVNTLSDGELQKTMTAKALAQETPVILLDEPTAFLDFPSKVETMILLKRLAKERGKTVFMSTHDVNISLQLADRIWLMDKEYGVTTGDPRTLPESGDLQKYFHGEGIRFDTARCQFDIMA